MNKKNLKIKKKYNKNLKNKKNSNASLLMDVVILVYLYIRFVTLIIINKSLLYTYR